ncbi:hypothetical protein LOC67_07640 [Stieleria sp. JC731]|uniref:hypothetical protein n=1 Tax=Pirellulaceae TaxID=2691357 RepID=UPI001E478148|nr:hypothetical protein [Stieleria sp. JC731]MCC9600429.1 hypothetical protein [Stieleria sp. JC731]
MSSLADLKRLSVLLLLALCTIPGPRLVAHSHDSESLSSEAYFDHMAEYHSEASELAIPPDCPHYHWVFSWDDFRSKGVFPHTAQPCTALQTDELDQFTTVTQVPPAFAADPFLQWKPARLSERSVCLYDCNVAPSTERARLCVWTC